MSATAPGDFYDRRVISPINPAEVALAERIVEIQLAAYAVEAALIDFDGIPQLHETAADVAGRTDLTWLGAFDVRDQHQLAGIIAWELVEPAGADGSDAVLDIDRLAIDPAFARRGHGRRLVGAVPRTHRTIVSTGSKNAPAVSLYTSEAFTVIGETEIVPDVFTTQFAREPI